MFAIDKSLIYEEKAIKTDSIFNHHVLFIYNVRPNQINNNKQDQYY